VAWHLAIIILIFDLLDFSNLRVNLVLDAVEVIVADQAQKSILIRDFERSFWRLAFSFKRKIVLV
jgi:hypothetical protein